MGRHSCCAKQKLRKGLWSPEEDQKLFNHITRFGVGCWSSVPKLAGLQRCGKSCRLRWINYLRPDLKRGMFSQQEEDIILSLHEVLGNRWAQIAAQLPGRTDNEIKNFWNSCLKKKLLKQGIDPATHKPFITQQQQQIIKQEIINNISETQPPPQQQVSLQHNDHFSSVSPFLISNSTCYYDAPPFLTEASSRDEIINKPHQEWVDPLLSYYESYMTSHQQQQQQYQYYYGTSSNSYGIICSSSMPSLTSSDQNNLSSAITEFSDSKISSSNNSSNMSSYNNVMEVNNNNNSNNNNSGSFHQFHNEGDGVKSEEEVAVGLNNNNINNNNTSYLWQETVQLQNHNSVDFNGYPLMTSFSSQDVTPVTYDVLRHMHVNSSSL